MTQIFLLLHDQTLVVLQSQQKPEDILAEVQAGTWHPPAPYRGLVPNTLAAFANCGQVVIGQRSTIALQPEPPSLKLTERQMNVLQGLAAGKTSRQIGARLGLTERAVNWHIGVVKERLGVQTRAQAVVRAVALGLCRMDGG